MNVISLLSLFHKNTYQVYHLLLSNKCWFVQGHRRLSIALPSLDLNNLTYFISQSVINLISNYVEGEINTFVDRGIVMDSLVTMSSSSWLFLAIFCSSINWSVNTREITMQVKKKKQASLTCMQDWPFAHQECHTCRSLIKYYKSRIFRD